MWHGFKKENEIINSEFSKSLPGLCATDLELDPKGKPLNTPGAKADANKIRPWLVLGAFSRALEEVSKVGTAGAKKYTDNGWKTVPSAEQRYMDAFMRHMLKLGKGEKYDNDPSCTNTHHIANMVWNLLAVLELELSDTK